MPVPAAGFRASGRALATGASTNLVELRAPATARPRVTELKVWAEAATALSLALFRTTAAGTAGTAVTPEKDDPGLAAALASCLTLPTGGTLAATALERAFLSAIGASVAFYWPDGLLIPTGGSMVLRNDVAAAGPAITWSWAWVED